MFWNAWWPWFVRTAYADLAGETGGGGIGIDNPIKPIDSLTGLLNAILNIVVQIGVPIVVLAVIYVGFLFVKAQGNEEKLKEAKNAFVWVVVGAAIVLGAYVIATAIQTTINNLV